MLKVSNLGSGVVATVANSEWMVRLPQILQDKGPCTIRLMKGRIQGCNDSTFNSIAKLWCETSIPIQGVSTEVSAGQASTGYNELFDVDLAQYQPWSYVVGPTDTTSTLFAMPREYRAQPYEFRCNGLPSYISFRAMVMLTTLDIGEAFGSKVIPLYTQSTTLKPQVEFHLQIVFDSSREK